MAVFQLGALVTGIVGSIGGTTFKRQGSSLVMQRKSNGASRNSVLQNIRLSQNSRIFRSWNLLSDADKLAWENIASSTLVKNKFNEAVYISGVSFQRKCQLQMAPISYGAIRPDLFTTNLVSITVNSCAIYWNDATFAFNATVSEDGANCVFMLEFSLNNLNAPDYSISGLFTISSLTNGSTINLWDALIAKYPFLNDNYNVRLYYYSVNNSGWRTPTFMTEVAVG